MAILLDADQGTSQASGSATTITLTTSAAAASPARIYAFIFNGGGTTLTVTDNSGLGYGNWTIDKQDAGGFLFIASIHATSGLPSGTVITATFGASVSARAIASVSFTGIASSSALDVATLRSANNETNWLSASATPTSGDRIVLGFAETNGAGSPTSVPTGGWTEAHDWTISGSQVSLTTVYQILTADGSTAYQPGGTWSSSQSGASEAYITAAYKSDGTSLPAWDKVVVQTFPYERQQVLYGPRWMMGAGDRPADWTVLPPNVDSPGWVRIRHRRTF